MRNPNSFIESEVRKDDNVTKHIGIGEKMHSRRWFLQRMVAAGIAALCTISAHDTSAKKPDWLTVEGVNRIGKERATRAIEAAHHWKARYSVSRRIKIVPLEVSEKEMLPNGGMATTLEMAEPGLIRIGKEGDPYHIVLHAMTHASQPDTPTLLRDPIPFVDGTILGFHGLSLLVRLKNGEKIRFTKIEEGMAERNASAIVGYTVTDPRYFELGKLARQHFPFDQYPDAHQWAQVNNVPALMSARLNLPFDTRLTSEHFESVMREYQEAWNRGLRGVK